MAYTKQQRQMAKEKGHALVTISFDYRPVKGSKCGAMEWTAPVSV